MEPGLARCDHGQHVARRRQAGLLEVLVHVHVGQARVQARLSLRPLVQHRVAHGSQAGELPPDTGLRAVVQRVVGREAALHTVRERCASCN